MYPRALVMSCWVIPHDMQSSVDDNRITYLFSRYYFGNCKKLCRYPTSPTLTAFYPFFSGCHNITPPQLSAADRPIQICGVPLITTKLVCNYVQKVIFDDNVILIIFLFSNEVETLWWVSNFHDTGDRETYSHSRFSPPFLMVL